MRTLAMRFNGILRAGVSEPLDAWNEDAMDSGLGPIVRFARVLGRDIDAVRNAIEQPWSNRQVEGLKTLKRHVRPRWRRTPARSYAPLSSQKLRQNP